MVDENKGRPIILVKATSGTGSEARRRAQKVGEEVLKLPGAGATKRSTYQGYLLNAKKIAVGALVQVVDPPGILLSIANRSEESPSSERAYIAKAVQTWPRDIYNPAIELPDPLQPLQVNLGTFRDYLFNTTQLDGTAFATLPLFYMSPATADNRGIYAPFVGWTDRDDDPVEPDSITYTMVLFNAPSQISNRANDGIQFSEAFIGTLAPGYQGLPRYGNSTLRSGRFNPLVTMQAVGTYLYAALPTIRNITDPDNLWKYQAGSTGVLVVRLRRQTELNPNDPQFNKFVVDWSHHFRLEDEVNYPLLLEDWDSSLPWGDEFSTYVFGPVGEFNAAGEPVFGKTSNVCLTPLVTVRDDMLEVHFATKIARQWYDDRPIYNGPFAGNKPMQVQVQSAVVRLSAGITVDPDTGLSTIGAVTRDVLAQDITGAADNAVLSLGNYGDNFCRFFIPLWSGVVNGKSVQCIGVRKYVRYEDVGAAEDQQLHMTSFGSQRTSFSWLYSGGGFNPETKIWGRLDVPESPREYWWYVDGVLTVVPCAQVGHSWIGFNGEYTDRVGDTEWEGSKVIYTEYDSAGNPVFNNNWPTMMVRSFAPISDTLVAYTGFGYSGWDPDGPFDVSAGQDIITLNTDAKFATLATFNIETGEVVELRRDDRGAKRRRSTVSCYQQEIRNTSDEVVVQACMLYRLGMQQSDTVAGTDADGVLFLTKDGAQNWTEIMVGNMGGNGVFYTGNELWNPHYGEIFRKG